MHLHTAHPKIRISHYVCEFIATFSLVFIGSLAIVTFMGSEKIEEIIPSDEGRFLCVVVTFIATTLVLVFSPLGKISGTHMNPAVSFAFWLEKHLKTVDFIFYVLVQLLAAVSASLLVDFLLPEMVIKSSMDIPAPQTENRLIFEFIAEVAASAVLISFLFFFLSEHHLVKYTGLLIGCYILFIKLISLESVSLGLNPARYLGAATAIQHFEHAWIYMTAPLLGAALAVYIHRKWSVLKRPKFFRLNHQEGYLEAFFHKHLKKNNLKDK